MTATFAMASLLVVGSVPAGAASPEAKPLPAGTRVTEATPELRAEKVKGTDKGGVTAQSFPCWTSFQPPSPYGGAMWHTYNNCANHGAYVKPGYLYSYTGEFVPTGGCAWVAASSNAPGVADMVRWHYSQTVPSGANYVTVFC